MKSVGFDVLSKRFKDEDFCIGILKKHRWGSTVKCPHCQATNIYQTNRGYKCGKCLKKFTLTTGTLLENTKIDFGKWFWLMSAVVCYGEINVSNAAERVGLTYATTLKIVKVIKNNPSQNIFYLDGNLLKAKNVEYSFLYHTTEEKTNIQKARDILLVEKMELEAKLKALNECIEIFSKY